jgi:hypothetical protein
LWIEAIGYLGVLLTVATYTVSTMIPLRILGITSSIVFLVYGAVTSDMPAMVMELILIPVNLYHLVQMLRLIRKARAAAESDLSMDWLKPFTKSRKVASGTVIFAQGDPADAMFYIQSGRFRLREAGIELKPGEVVGELGLLAPDNRRTLSLECIEDGVLGRISYDAFKQLYFQNPQFGFDFLRLVSGRLFRNVEMAKANAAMGAAPADG